MIVTTPNGPLINFMEFADSQQRMLHLFRTHLDRVSRSQAHELPGVEAEQLFWAPADSQALVLWRLLGRNRRELARSARTFVTIEKAQLNARALVSARGHLAVQVVSIGDDYSWCLSLFGTPMLVAARWFATADQAFAAGELAERELPEASVTHSSRKLTIAVTGPLALDTVDAPNHPFLLQGFSRPLNGSPEATNVADGNASN